MKKKLKPIIVAIDCQPVSRVDNASNLFNRSLRTRHAPTSFNVDITRSTESSSTGNNNIEDNKNKRRLKDTSNWADFPFKKRHDHSISI